MSRREFTVLLLLVLVIASGLFLAGCGGSGQLSLDRGNPNLGSNDLRAVFVVAPDPSAPPTDDLELAGSAYLTLWEPEGPTKPVDVINIRVFLKQPFETESGEEGISFVARQETDHASDPEHVFIKIPRIRLKPSSGSVYVSYVEPKNMSGSEAADTTPFRAFRQQLLKGNIRVNPFYASGSPKLVGAVLEGRYVIEHETRALADGGTLTVERSEVLARDFNGRFTSIVHVVVQGSDFAADQVLLVAKVDSPTITYALVGRAGRDGTTTFQTSAADIDLSFSIDPSTNPSLAKFYAAVALYGVRCHVQMKNSEGEIQDVDIDFSREDGSL